MRQYPEGMDDLLGLGVMRGQAGAAAELEREVGAKCKLTVYV